MYASHWKTRLRTGVASTMYDGQVGSAGPGVPSVQLSCSSHDWYHQRWCLGSASQLSYMLRIDAMPGASIDSTIGTMMSTRSSRLCAVASLMSVVRRRCSVGAE